MKDRWLGPKVVEWIESIKQLAKVAERYPLSTYAGFTQSLQAEWQYICGYVAGAEQHMEPVEISTGAEVKDVICTLLGNSVKQGGLNIHNPVEGPAVRTHQVSVEAGETLVASLKACGELDLTLNQETVMRAGADARKERVEGKMSFLKGTMATNSRAVKKRLGRIGECGSWLTPTHSKLNGILLSMEEWQENARLQYGWRPISL